MIDAKKNRLDYGRQLAPPEGYQLDHAITTTYSLDLEAILLIPVALFFSEEMDIDPIEIRDDTLEALIDAAKKITIYHQKGKIKVPDHYSQLMAYWEKGLCPVHLEAHNRSFHPKTWIIRYIQEDGNGVKYRIINTSRNLTFSRDWDLAVTTEGDVDSTNAGLNDELIDFISYLHKFKKIPTSFFEELPKVAFETLEGFKEILFHPIGIENKTGQVYQNPLVTDELTKDFRLIMSPFLDAKTITQLTKNCHKTVLFSSQDELNRVHPDVLELVDQVYMFSPFIESAEKDGLFSEEGGESLYQSLHAKYYIVQRDGRRSWFVGSANATSPAHERNVEFLIEFKGGNFAYRPEEIVSELTNPNTNDLRLFEPYEGEYQAETESNIHWKQTLRRLIHDLSAIRFSGDVFKNENDAYDLEITLPKKTMNPLPEDVTIRVKPLPERNLESVSLTFEAGQVIDKFKGYQEEELSPFLIIEIHRNGELEKKFIVDMAIDLDQFKNRLNRIFSKIISNKSKFLNYLSFLLSESTPSIISDLPVTQKQISASSYYNGIAFFEGTPVYEKLLVAASRDPKKLKKINKLIERIKGQTGENNEPVLSSDFEELWDIFKPFAK